MNGRPGPESWRGRRLAHLTLAIAAAVAGVVWAIFLDGPWLTAGLLVLGGVLLAQGMRKGAREWAEDAAGGRPTAPGGPSGSRILVERPAKGYADRRRGYRVLVDGRVTGILFPGEKIEVPTEPGEHVIQARIDWARSRPVTVRVPVEGIARLVAQPRPAWAAMFWVTLGARRYPNLRSVDARRVSPARAGPS